MLEAGDRLLNYLATRPKSRPSEIEGSDEFEQVGTYPLTTYMRLGAIGQADLAKRHDPKFIQKLDAVLADIATDIEIDPDLAAQRSGLCVFFLKRPGAEAASLSTRPFDLYDGRRNVLDV